MRLWAGSSKQFIDDATRNQIAEKLKLSFFNYYRFNPCPGEVRSWRNSLRALSQSFQSANLIDHGILLEYQLPLTSQRLDCMICGRDDEKKDNAVIVELKQWECCEESHADNEVVTWVGGRMREILHPSVQVGQYHRYLQDTHTAFEVPKIQTPIIRPVAATHPAACRNLVSAHPKKPRLSVKISGIIKIGSPI